MGQDELNLVIKKFKKKYRQSLDNCGGWCIFVLSMGGDDNLPERKPIKEPFTLEGGLFTSCRQQRSFLFSPSVLLLLGRGVL